MTPSLRKLILTAHITFSVGWIGAVAGFLALAITAVDSKGAQMGSAAYLSMALIARFVIVPLAFASLLTGVVQALGTPWGLFRHYWVSVKLLLTLLATVVLLLNIRLIGLAARQAAAAALPSAQLKASGRELLVHSAGGLLVLIVVTTLSVFKPWGLTRYGRSKLVKGGANFSEIHPPSYSPNSPSGPDGKKTADGLPLGFKVFLALVTLLALVFVALHLTGHGLHHGH